MAWLSYIKLQPQYALPVLNVRGRDFSLWRCFGLYFQDTTSLTPWLQRKENRLAHSVQANCQGLTADSWVGPFM
jgi:hypothetical protein